MQLFLIYIAHAERLGVHQGTGPHILRNAVFGIGQRDPIARPWSREKAVVLQGDVKLPAGIRDNMNKAGMSRLVWLCNGLGP